MNNYVNKNYTFILVKSCGANVTGDGLSTSLRSPTVESSNDKF